MNEITRITLKFSIFISLLIFKCLHVEIFSLFELLEISHTIDFEVIIECQGAGFNKLGSVVIDLTGKHQDENEYLCKQIIFGLLYTALDHLDTYELHKAKYAVTLSRSISISPWRFCIRLTSLHV